jgi:hypothetical protein
LSPERHAPPPRHEQLLLASLDMLTVMAFDAVSLLQPPQFERLNPSTHDQGDSRFWNPPSSRSRI